MNINIIYFYNLSSHTWVFHCNISPETGSQHAAPWYAISRNTSQRYCHIAVQGEGLQNKWQITQLIISFVYENVTFLFFFLNTFVFFMKRLLSLHILYSFLVVLAPCTTPSLKWVELCLCVHSCIDLIYNKGEKVFSYFSMIEFLQLCT